MPLECPSLQLGMETMTGLRQKRFNIGDRRNSAVSEKSRAEKREEKEGLGPLKQAEQIYSTKGG